MNVSWRLIHAARNSYAILYAACEKEGFILHPSDSPAGDITCYSLTSINELLYQSEIRDAGCITIVGGPHATACPRTVAEYADFVITGEGEYTLPRLLTELKWGRTGKIPGVTTRDFSLPATSSVRLDAYPAFAQMKGYVEISRGCPFACGYCQTPQIFGHCMRHRSIDTITEYANRYEHSRFVTPNAFAYGSDGIHPRWEKIEAVFKRLEHRIYFGTFPSEVRPEFICDKSLDLVTRYCANTKIHFGAQSGSDRILQCLMRGHTVQDVLSATDLCLEYSLTPVVDFIVGFPFETDEEQESTVALIREVARHGAVHVHHFMPLPGTPLAGQDPRPILALTRNVCGKLALAGKLTGSWEPAVEKL
jgi:B12-binding domain/radical SAM domain protein